MRFDAELLSNATSTKSKDQWTSFEASVFSVNMPGYKRLHEQCHQLRGWGVVYLLHLPACALQYRYLNNKQGEAAVLAPCGDMQTLL
jgi:hypothetical protein